MPILKTSTSKILEKLRKILKLKSCYHICGKKDNFFFHFTWKKDRYAKLEVTELVRILTLIVVLCIKEGIFVTSKYKRLQSFYHFSHIRSVINPCTDDTECNRHVSSKWHQWNQNVCSCNSVCSRKEFQNLST